MKSCHKTDILHEKLNCLCILKKAHEHQQVNEVTLSKLKMISFITNVLKKFDKIKNRRLLIPLNSYRGNKGSVFLLKSHKQSQERSRKFQLKH